MNIYETLNQQIEKKSQLSVIILLIIAGITGLIGYPFLKVPYEFVSAWLTVLAILIGINGILLIQKGTKVYGRAAVFLSFIFSALALFFVMIVGAVPIYETANGSLLAYSRLAAIGLSAPLFASLAVGFTIIGFVLLIIGLFKDIDALLKD